MHTASVPDGAEAGLSKAKSVTVAEKNVPYCRHCYHTEVKYTQTANTCC